MEIGQKFRRIFQNLKRNADNSEGEMQESEVANQIKRDFLANVSHEVRTPINIILGYNEMILRETRESHTASYAFHVQTAGRMLLSSINDILDFSSIEEGNLKLETAPYSILSVLQDMMSYAGYEAEKKKLDLKISIDENLPQQLCGDAVRLMQILNNLISNAVKYTNEGLVEVTVLWKQTEEQKGILSVKIKDSGIGMKQEDIARISDSFSRFDYRNTRNIQGMGLGLAVVTRLLVLMNSSLSIQSEYGKGSVFSFELLQEVEDASPVGKVEIGAEQYWNHQVELEESFTAEAAKLLAVDDNVMNLDLLKGILKNTKIQIDTASNGKEALELIREKKYHLIFLDHMMPVMDGMETLKHIKEENLCADTPVIVLTANVVAGVKETYLSAGFDDYLSKPIIGKQLEAVVKKYLPKDLVKEDTNHIEKEQSIKEESGLLSQLSFLDTATGMAYCCDSEDFYKEMLMSYLNSGKYEDIISFYKEKDWENYRIQVHALKSTSLSIGATQVSEQAKQLEMAAKEGNIAYIEEHHEEVLQNYKRLLDRMAAVFNKPQQEAAHAEGVMEDAPYILIVDDDAMNLRIAEKMLEQMFAVRCAKSGEEALQVLQEDIPNLILLDLHMPGMDGFEVMDRIRAREEYRDIPIIFLTADNDREVEIKGFKEGALDFITKPFIADIMIQRVSRILELDRLQKNLQAEVEKQTKKAEERRKKIERLSMQVMKTLAGTIDAKDKYTNGHSMRVAQYSKEIARRIGKTTEEQEDIYYMGLLHDIGKIGIPDEIISKTSGLTDEEYALIKSHPMIGADILKNMSEIPGIDKGARWHHEKYDGTGYPDGLKGEEIPEVARIIGVADAYDAMASKRSYRDVLPQQVVRAEIKSGKGTQFDPYFADKMLEMIDEDKSYDMREK